MAAVPGTGANLSVYDEVIIGPGGTDQSELTLVTLRMQLQAEEATAVLVLRVTNNESTDSAMQVYWQQAWYGRDGDSTYPLAGGLSNAGQVRTPTGDPVQNTYNWAVNALGIKAASRFQLPLLNTNADTGDAAGMGWLSTVTPGDYELVDGELYMDDNLTSVLGRAKEDWYQFVQPERVSSGTATVNWNATQAKNIIITGTTSRDVNLSTDQGLVPRGSIVRVFNLGTGLGMTVTVKVGGSTLASLALTQMGEFLFYVDGSGNSKWLTLQKALSTGQLP